MECWMAERSSGSGRSKVERRLRRVRGLRGFAGGVVVVAEVFAAEAGAAAAVAVGEDVAALVAFRCFGLRFDGGVHWSPPHGAVSGAKSSKEKG